MKNNIVQLRNVLILLTVIVLLASCLGNKVKLGNLESGASVSFVRSAENGWGIEISGETAPLLTQQKPVSIETFAGKQNVNQLVAGYMYVKSESGAVVATAKVTSEKGATFNVEDRWTISGTVLSLNRKVSVAGTADSTGFYSAVSLVSAPTVKWEETKYLIPGILYGETTHQPLTLAGRKFVLQRQTFLDKRRLYGCSIIRSFF